MALAPIPQDPFTYRGKLCDDIKTKIRDAFLTLHEQPEAKEFLNNVKSNRFVAMSDKDYDIIRALREARESQ